MDRLVDISLQFVQCLVLLTDKPTNVTCCRVLWCCWRWYEHGCRIDVYQSAEALTVNRINHQLCVLLAHFYADDVTPQVITALFWLQFTMLNN